MIVQSRNYKEMMKKQVRFILSLFELERPSLGTLDPYPTNCKSLRDHGL